MCSEIPRHCCRWRSVGLPLSTQNTVLQRWGNAEVVWCSGVQASGVSPKVFICTCKLIWKFMGNGCPNSDGHLKICGHELWFSQVPRWDIGSQSWAADLGLGPDSPKHSSHSTLSDSTQCLSAVSIFVLVCVLNWSPFLWQLELALYEKDGFPSLYSFMVGSPTEGSKSFPLGSHLWKVRVEGSGQGASGDFLWSVLTRNSCPASSPGGPWESSRAVLLQEYVVYQWS